VPCPHPSSLVCPPAWPLELAATPPQPHDGARHEYPRHNGSLARVRGLTGVFVQHARGKLGRWNGPIHAKHCLAGALAVCTERYLKYRTRPIVRVGMYAGGITMDRATCMALHSPYACKRGS
jgi:hypothetical protein